MVAVAAPAETRASGAGPQPPEKVRKLQWELYQAAKRSGKRRFHALWQCVTDRHVLWEAWRRVKANRGAAGVDGKTLKATEDQGLEEFIEGLEKDLKAGRYRLQSEVGRGGQGAVLSVWDDDLRRNLAMKIAFGRSSPESCTAWRPTRSHRD